MSELDPNELTQRAIRFYNRYGDEVENLRKLLDVRLNQLALAYTTQNSLPRESIQVLSRVKSLSSFLNKLSKKNWPQFYYPTEVATDLVGARMICWFVDDCYQILDSIRHSRQFSTREDSIEDYIKSNGFYSGLT